MDVLPQTDRGGLPERIRQSDTELLLSLQGDGRHTLGDGGMNRYLNRYRPESGVLAFGSCTSSTISELGFAAAERLHGWLRSLDARFLPMASSDLYERVRIELVSNIAMYQALQTDVVITPSGTDAEFIPMLVGLADGRPLTNVIVAPAETGSGTLPAAGGLHFDGTTPAGVEVQPGTPVSERVAEQVTVVEVDGRRADGRARSVVDIDRQVTEVVEQRVAAGDTALVHLIAHSKTGLHAPSIDAIDALTAAHPGQVLVVVDAAQGRFSRSGLDRSLRRGWMTIVTGSKFFGGPPFAGAVLVPHATWAARTRPSLPEGFGNYFCPTMFPPSWSAARGSLEPGTNFGLLLRWWAALAEIRDYYSVPARLRFEVLQHFQAEVPRQLAESPLFDTDLVAPPVAEQGAVRLLESNTTVFPFRCFRPDGSVLDLDELGTVRHLLRGADHPGDPRGGRPPAEIGQPVPLGRDPAAPAVLRIALGARDITRTCVVGEAGPTFRDRLDRLADDVTAVVTGLASVIEADSAALAAAGRPR